MKLITFQVISVEKRGNYFSVNSIFIKLYLRYIYEKNLYFSQISALISTLIVHFGNFNSQFDVTNVAKETRSKTYRELFIVSQRALLPPLVLIRNPNAE